MKTTTYYDLNIVEGTDIVNPLTVDNPNYQKIDETMHDNAVAGVTLATELTNSTIHAITRENSDCSVIRFIATSRWKAGDSVTVDGVPVLALLPSGETLPDGAYVINANVLCVLTGTNLTVYVGKSATDANEIAFNDTTVGAELVRLDGEAVRLDGEVTRLDGEVTRLDGEVDNLTSNFDALTTHSLEEEEIGTFFGKTLYRKSFALKTPSTKNTTTKLTNNSPLNGCTIVKISGAAYSTSGNFGIPCSHYENSAYISTWVSGGDVYCNTNSDSYISLDLYVTVEYTK